jgi:hypothetical protein
MLFLLTRDSGLINGRYIVRISPVQSFPNGREYHDITYMVGEDVRRAQADAGIVTEFIEED